MKLVRDLKFERIRANADSDRRGIWMSESDFRLPLCLEEANAESPSHVTPLRRSNLRDLRGGSERSVESWKEFAGKLET